LKQLITALIIMGLLPAARGATLPSPSLIPLPQKMEVQAGAFRLTRTTRICTDQPARASGDFLAARLRQATGYPLNVVADKPDGDDLLITTQAANPALGAEGYEVTITPTRAEIRAPHPAGAFYGVQSLLQLLPPTVYAPTPTLGAKWELPAVRIQDQPRFSWRGLMVDVGRHYFPPADLKQMIDVMAMLKFNTLHWHLTEDQGWRLEIKKYPKLTGVGAWRDSSPPYGNRNSDDGQRYGGFYSQAEVKDIVAYATARHITVVPEIEMPGHAAAAIAAYPELGNTDIPNYAPRVMTRWGVHPYIFAPKEETFRFLEEVLTGVCELFPSPFIHIGGDEAPKSQWRQSKFAQEVMQREGLKNEEELQSWFIGRIGTFLESKHRRLIGWDEIQEGGLPRTATMMVWRDAKWARHALALGNDVVMATTSHTYLDYYPANGESELAKGKKYEAIGGNLPLEKVYSYNPAFVAENPAQEKQILGTQGQLWSEYIKDAWKLQYLAFPRAMAVAEVAWTPQAQRNWKDFSGRLKEQEQRLDELGVNYRRDSSVQIGGWMPSQINTQFVTLEWDATAAISSVGKLAVSLNYLEGAHGIRIESVKLLADGHEVAADVHDGFAGGRPRKPVYLLSLPEPKPGAHYRLEARVAGDGGTDSRGTVVLELSPPATGDQVAPRP